MARIALGFRGEGVVCDDRLPFLRSADEAVRFKTEALLGLRLQQALELRAAARLAPKHEIAADRKSTRLNSSHGYISYAVFCLKKKKKNVTSNEIISTFLVR